MKKIVLSSLLTAVLMLVLFLFGTGYYVGNYAVHFGLERGTAEHPQEPPRAYALLMPPEARRYTKPDAPAENWQVESRDDLHLKLHATHFSPGVPSNKWVIVVHGYGCTEANSWYIAANYLQMGWHVLTPDLRASGKSEGRYLTLGYRESDDLELWASRIAQEYPKAKVVLHGVSMGAATVMIAAGKENLPRNVVAAVEDCGYTSAYDELAGQLTSSFRIPAFPMMDLLDWRCRRVAGFSLHDAVPIEAVRHARVPLLFIHGTKDTLVPPEMAQELYDAADAPAKELLYIDGAAHAAASQKDQETYFRTVARFVAPYVDP